MFSRVMSACFFLFFVIPLLASATAIPRDGDCNTGSIQCCNTIQNATPTVIGMLSGLLGTVLGPVTGLIGLNCNAITLGGAGGNACSAQPVCCTNNTFSGLIALGCMPININL